MFNEVLKPKLRLKAWRRLFRKTRGKPATPRDRQTATPRDRQTATPRDRQTATPRGKQRTPWGGMRRPVRSRRQPRSVSRERHVETLVVIDSKVTDYYRQHRDVRHPHGLTAYVLTIMNIVSAYSGATPLRASALTHRLGRRPTGFQQYSYC